MQNRNRFWKTSISKTQTQNKSHNREGLGLEPLSELILKQDSNQEILNEWIVEFNSHVKKKSKNRALRAKDILAERISEDAELRKD